MYPVLAPASFIEGVVDLVFAEISDGKAGSPDDKLPNIDKLLALLAPVLTSGLAEPAEFYLLRLLALGTYYPITFSQWAEATLMKRNGKNPPSKNTDVIGTSYGLLNTLGRSTGSMRIIRHETFDIWRGENLRRSKSIKGRTELLSLPEKEVDTEQLISETLRKNFIEMEKRWQAEYESAFEPGDANSAKRDELKRLVVELCAVSSGSTEDFPKNDIRFTESDPSLRPSMLQSCVPTLLVDTAQLPHSVAGLVQDGTIGALFLACMQTGFSAQRWTDRSHMAGYGIPLLNLFTTSDVKRYDQVYFDSVATHGDPRGTGNAFVDILVAFHGRYKVIPRATVALARYGPDQSSLTALSALATKLLTATPMHTVRDAVTSQPRPLAATDEVARLHILGMWVHCLRRFKGKHFNAVEKLQELVNGGRLPPTAAYVVGVDAGSEPSVLFLSASDATLEKLKAIRFLSQAVLKFGNGLDIPKPAALQSDDNSKRRTSGDSSPAPQPKRRVVASSSSDPRLSNDSMQALVAQMNRIAAALSEIGVPFFVDPNRPYAQALIWPAAAKIVRPGEDLSGADMDAIISQVGPSVEALRAEACYARMFSQSDARLPKFVADALTKDYVAKSLESPDMLGGVPGYIAFITSLIDEGKWNAGDIPAVHAQLANVEYGLRMVRETWSANRVSAFLRSLNLGRLVIPEQTGDDLEVKFATFEIMFSFMIKVILDYYVQSPATAFAELYALAPQPRPQPPYYSSSSSAAAAAAAAVAQKAAPEPPQPKQSQSQPPYYSSSSDAAAAVAKPPVSSLKAAPEPPQPKQSVVIRIRRPEPSAPRTPVPSPMEDEPAQSPQLVLPAPAPSTSSLAAQSPQLVLPTPAPSTSSLAAQSPQLVLPTPAPSTSSLAARLPPALMLSPGGVGDVPSAVYPSLQALYQDEIDSLWALDDTIRGIDIERDLVADRPAVPARY